MSCTVDIRMYAPTDSGPVRALFVRVNRLLAPPDLAQAFEDYIERSLAEEIDRIPQYYGDRDGSFWVAVDCGRLIGMFGLEMAGPGAFELRRMYVDPDVRRRGIARKMLSFAEDHARSTGARELVLSTSEIQKEALALYRGAGYRETRREIASTASNKTIGGGIQRYYFSKLL